MSPDAPNRESLQVNDRRPPNSSGKRILVVDDEPAVAKSIKLILQNIGYAVELAESAEQGVIVFENGKYDLVLTDFALGKMTGLDLARAIKSKHPNQPIILITAYAESLNMGKERLSDFVCVLGKPFSMEEMQAALAKAFGG